MNRSVGSLRAQSPVQQTKRGAAMPIQDQWAWCNKCQALCFAGGASLGACPAGGQHNHAGSGNYALVDTEATVPGQDNWRWCKKCQALAFAGHPAPGKCSGGGVHDHSSSGNYNLLRSSNNAPGQSNWRWCNRCEVLAFAGGASVGACGAGGVHDHTGSGDYVLAQVADCRLLQQEVAALQAQITDIKNSEGNIQGPNNTNPGKDDPEMLAEVKALQKEMSAKSAAYSQCQASRSKLLDALRLLPGPRHFGPVPLWVMGHNTNSIAEVQAALDQGANSVEVDVTAYAHDRDTLCIDHAGALGDDPGGPNAPEFVAFLHDLRKVVDARPELAMVMFDLKPPAFDIKFGSVLMNNIRTILTSDGANNLSVILSVADVTGLDDGMPESCVLDNIPGGLRTREGLMIDANNSADNVAGYFKNKGVTRFGYGNGTSFGLSDEGAMVYRTPIEKACWMREVIGGPGFVDAWTVNSVDSLKLYLRLGLNAFICDQQGIERVRNLLLDAEFSKRYRMAQRFDDPMVADRFAYGLTVKTTDTESAGPDATITFPLTADNGSASTTVDTNFNARMEAGLTNFVVLYGPELGNLTSVSVQSDMTHNGPGWHLDTIVVESVRYGVKKTASFKTWIETTNVVTRTLS